MMLLIYITLTTFLFYEINTAMAADMTVREHIEELRTRMLHIIISVTVITIFSLSFGMKPYYSHGIAQPLYYPYPDVFHNVATQLTSQMANALLPSGVKLIQTAPGQAFFAQLYVSLLIGIIASMPIIIKEVYGFVSPAVGRKTKQIGIVSVFLPTLSLFIAGITFSYLIVIPFTIDFLYRYGQSLGVATFLNISDFVSFVLQFFLGFGIAFELPIIMYAISLTQLLDPKFWRHNFRYATIILVIFGAIITPDGSGITMWFVAGPMIVLYLIGMFAIERRERTRAQLSIDA